MTSCFIYILLLTVRLLFLLEHFFIVYFNFAVHFCFLFSQVNLSLYPSTVHVITNIVFATYGISLTAVFDPSEYVSVFDAGIGSHLIHRNFADIPRPELIKTYDVLSSVFIYDLEAVIAQLKGCLLDCFDWESNCCVVH